tara:strand:- start:11850 stop:12170 length:321 start_codon:yes stop_codon:yes gene_type:complete
MSNNQTPIQPLGDRVLIKQIEEKEQMKDGIYIPEAAQEKSQEAEVVALGTGRKNDKGESVEFSVKVGDRVLTSKYGGTEVSVSGQTYMLVREDDILGVMQTSACSA